MAPKAGSIPAHTSPRKRRAGFRCDCGVVHWQESESEDVLNIGRRSRSYSAGNPPGIEAPRPRLSIPGLHRPQVR